MIDYEKVKQLVAREVEENITDFCWTAGYFYSALRGLTRIWWHQSKTPIPPIREFRFSEELHTVLYQKLDRMQDIELSPPMFDRLSEELSNLFKCSFASVRTPDEIIEELREDSEMRAEVVEMVLSETGETSNRRDQRLFLQRMLSGDEDLRVLLNRQTEKKGFPFFL